MARIETFNKNNPPPTNCDLIRLDRLKDGTYQISASFQSGEKEAIFNYSPEPLDHAAAVTKAEELASKYSVDTIYVDEETTLP